MLWGVFAVPVTDNYIRTHQWLRELHRFTQQALVGVYFRLPDDEQVWLGRYNQAHQRVTAAAAAAAFFTGEERQG